MEAVTDVDFRNFRRSLPALQSACSIPKDTQALELGGILAYNNKDVCGSSCTDALDDLLSRRGVDARPACTELEKIEALVHGSRGVWGELRDRLRITGTNGIHVDRNSPIDKDAVDVFSPRRRGRDCDEAERPRRCDRTRDPNAPSAAGALRADGAKAPHHRRGRYPARHHLRDDRNQKAPSTAPRRMAELPLLLCCRARPLR